MITPMAPLSWAFLVFTAKPQVPRSMRAILPDTAAALVNGVVQPSVVEGPAAFAASSASTTSPVTPVGLSGGPKAAVPPM